MEKKINESFDDRYPYLKALKWLIRKVNAGSPEAYVKTNVAKLLNNRAPFEGVTLSQKAYDELRDAYYNYDPQAIINALNDAYQFALTNAQSNNAVINESMLRKIIRKTLSESVFGLSGSQLQDWGMRNPIDDYPIDKEEIKNTVNEFLPQLEKFMAFIDGIEEDEANGQAGKRGLASTFSMRSMWRDDDDFDKDEEEYFAKELRKTSTSLYGLKNLLDELLTYAN